MAASNHANYEFQVQVQQFWRQHQRDLPWRRPEPDGSYDAYKILVSELMLQQTQVSRVLPKYEAFLQQFPTVSQLAAADLAAVLRAWSGLGYNRRAKFLWQCAQQIVEHFNGQVPSELNQLTSLPGIGVNTAAAIAAYAFNQPVVFVETNIRSVMLHHFFSDQEGVSDRDILARVAATLPAENPRQWYWSLMDYGAYLKSSQPRHLHRAQAHVKQSTFAGSDRQLRGRVLKALADTPWSLSQLKRELHDQRTNKVLAQLEAEQLIHVDDGVVSLG